MKYTLIKKMIGVYRDERSVTTLLPGATMEMPPTNAQVGIALALHDGRHIRVFLDDLLECARADPSLSNWVKSGS